MQYVGSDSSGRLIVINSVYVKSIQHVESAHFVVVMTMGSQTFEYRFKDLMKCHSSMSPLDLQDLGDHHEVCEGFPPETVA